MQQNNTQVLENNIINKRSLKLSKYAIISYVYFFCNALFLPFGLLYTHILSPLFYYNLIKNKRETYFKPFFLFLFIYDGIHLFLGVNLKAFIVSNLLFTATYFSVVAIYYFVNHYNDLQKLIKQIVLINAVLVLFAIPFLFMDKPYIEWFWFINKLTKGVSNFPRLALLTYEASYYSLLLIPVLYYYWLKFLFHKIENNKWITILLVSIPMLLSLSFGVIGTSLLTAIIMCLFFIKKVFVYKRPLLIIFSISMVIIFTVSILYLYFPNNFLFIRLQNIIAGNDTSANGRTIESLTMAWRIADLKNSFFGAGLGQVKIMAPLVIQKYYNYWGELKTYYIPNAMGETLAIFGIVGVIVRLSVQVFLFFRTKVYSNYYRLSLFIFVFIYQFTGSYLTNIVEYVIWIFAFSSVFNQFDIKKATV